MVSASFCTFLGTLTNIYSLHRSVISVRVCKMHRSMHLYTCASITESHLITMCTCSRWKRRQWRSSARITVVRCSPFYVFRQNVTATYCNDRVTSGAVIATVTVAVSPVSLESAKSRRLSSTATEHPGVVARPDADAAVSTDLDRDRDLLIPPGWDCPWCLRQSCKPASQSGPGHVRTQSKR